jgi:hypothetical protein
MSYLKSLTSKDVIVTPFTVHKTFKYDGTIPGYNVSGPLQITGANAPYPLANGGIGTGSASLVYHSIKQLYFSNYLENPFSGQVSNASTASFNPDGTITGPRSTTNYINNIQSIDELRKFPTQSISGATSKGKIRVISIPQKLFGERIKPGSIISSISNNKFDDGQGNYKLLGVGTGSIIYDAGLIILTGANGNLGSSAPIANIQWESTTTIYETQYKCTIRANEYNYSLNPSLLTTYGSGSIIASGSATYKDFVTGSDFSPYVTTVGLYNDNQELLAVAKLAQPLPTSQTTDTTILINLDR